MEAIAVGTKLKIVKGCRALDLPKGVSVQVREIVALGADFSHSVRVVLLVLNGFQSGKTKVLYARHENRLSDVTLRLNTGRPDHAIEVQRK